MAKQGGAACAFIVLLVVAGTMTPRAAAFDLFPDIFGCLKSFVEVKDCVVKLAPSSLNLHIRLSQDCCKAIVDIEESCLPVVVTDPVFGAALANFTSSLCGVLADPKSPPIAP